MPREERDPAWNLVYLYTIYFHMQVMVTGVVGCGKMRLLKAGEREREREREYIMYCEMEVVRELSSGVCDGWLGLV